MISRRQIIADIGRKDRYLFCHLPNPDAHTKPLAVNLKFDTGLFQRREDRCADHRDGRDAPFLEPLQRGQRDTRRLS
jgi:hypothetical protein